MVPVFTCVSFFAESMTSILIGGYFYFFKSANVFYFCIASLLSVFLILYIVFTKETPHFLFEKRRF